MDPWIAILAGVVGYLSGSISSARWVTDRFAPGTDISITRQPISGTDDTFEIDTISASAVRVHVGARFGCLTAILDILKVLLPTLAFKLWQPGMPYFLIVAVFGLVGHNWPLYYRFKGGRGESAILGGMLVIDPFGLVITNIVGILLGWLTGKALVMRWTFLILFIPWLWLRKNDLSYVLYALAINVIFWIKMSADLRQFIYIVKRGGLRTQEELTGDLAMGRRLGRFLDRYGAPGLLRKFVSFRSTAE